MYVYTEPELNVLRTLVSRQTTSRASINKNKHNFASAQVFGLPC